jgi:hypothetical protein
MAVDEKKAAATASYARLPSGHQARPPGRLLVSAAGIAAQELSDDLLGTCRRRDLDDFGPADGPAGGGA